MSVASNTRSRKWQITINNPMDKGFTQDNIKQKIIDNFKSVIYFCMSDEVGEGGTYHTHVYICCANAVRFTTIKDLFEGGHFEMCNGSSQQNRDYVFKEGKHKNTDKEQTNLKDTHFEYGELPIERQGKRNDLDDLYDMVQADMTITDIIRDNPSYMLRRKEIEGLIYDRQLQQYGDTFRKMDVTYVYGSTGTGKTSDIIKNNGGYRKVYRVTDYKHPFDDYEGQKVIVFEEFRGQFNISMLLNCIDGHPYNLPCRFHNKIACYDKVFFTSNVSLKDLYRDEKYNEKETWQALLRRICCVRYYDPRGKIIDMATSDFMIADKPALATLPADKDGFVKVPDDLQAELPFV